MSPVDIVECYVSCSSSVPKEIFVIFNKVQEVFETDEFYSSEMELIVFGDFLTEIEENLSDDEISELDKAWEDIIDKIVEKD
jgi:hypothetical protein